MKVQTVAEFQHNIQPQQFSYTRTVRMRTMTLTDIRLSLSVSLLLSVFVSLCICECLCLSFSFSLSLSINVSQCLLLFLCRLSSLPALPLLETKGSYNIPSNLRPYPFLAHPRRVAAFLYRRPPFVRYSGVQKGCLGGLNREMLIRQLVDVCTFSLSADFRFPVEEMNSKWDMATII